MSEAEAVFEQVPEKRNIFRFLRKESSSKFEQEAMEKVRDIQAPGTLAHVSTVERLPSIMTEGILSASFAERIGKSSRKRFPNSPENQVYIAKIKAGGEEGVQNLEDLARRVALPEESHQIAILILDPHVEKESTQSEEWRSEKSVKLRISPRDIVGIAVGGSREALASLDPEPDMITSLTKDTKLTGSLKKEVVKVMEQLRSESRAQILPVYDLEGNLLWPKRISYAKILDSRNLNDNQ